MPRMPRGLAAAWREEAAAHVSFTQVSWRLAFACAPREHAPAPLRSCWHDATAGTRCAYGVDGFLRTTIKFASRGRGRRVLEEDENAAEGGRWRRALFPACCLSSLSEAPGWGFAQRAVKLTPPRRATAARLRRTRAQHATGAAILFSAVTGGAGASTRGKGGSRPRPSSGLLSSELRKTRRRTSRHRNGVLGTGAMGKAAAADAVGTWTPLLHGRLLCFIRTYFLLLPLGQAFAPTARRVA